VPFESTRRPVLTKLLTELEKIHPVTARTKIYELRSGTGQVALFLAKNTPAQIIGVEKNWPLYFFSRVKKEFSRSSHQIKYLNQDLFTVDLTPATIVYTYFSPQAYQKAQSKFEQELESGTIFVAWRYPFRSSHFKLLTTIKDRHTMYLYQKR